MLKFNFSILIVLIGLIQLISTECPDKTLYCFDNNEDLLGPIEVNQCWKWSRLSCQPCSASTTKRKVTYEKYIHYCLYFYPTTVEIIARESIFIDKFLSQRKMLG